jgi:Transposase and inactivated derivatives
MGKLHRIPVGRKPGQRRIEVPDVVEVPVRLAELAGAARQGLLAFSVGVGMQVLDVMMHEDVTRAAGPRGVHDPARIASRHGTDPRSVELGGRRVTIGRPRARTVDGREVPVPSYEFFAGGEWASEMAFERLLAGISTRNYQTSLEPVGELDSFGTSPQAVSARFAGRARAELARIMNADLSGLRLCAIFADGMGLGDHTVVVAIGVDHAGNKHVLGLREGTTENKGVCSALFSNFVERGLDVSGGVLCVIDGGKGLRHAVKKVFGALGLIHRCRLHKERNVEDHLPDHVWPGVRARMRGAWSNSDAAKGLRQMEALARSIAAPHPGAASSLREGMEETFTINRLGVPEKLAVTMFSTNVVESAISVARTAHRNVKRWRSGTMAERWAAAGMSVAQRKFRKVKGYREIPVLVAALHAHVERGLDTSGKIVA